jgi:hypothetical protein
MRIFQQGYGLAKLLRPELIERGCKERVVWLNYGMATLQQIEEQVKLLTKAEREALLDWLGNIVEDELEFTDEFKAKIERGEKDLREGRVRVRKP